MSHALEDISLGGLLFVAELLQNPWPWPSSFMLSTPFMIALSMSHVTPASLSTIKDFRVQQPQHLLSGGRAWVSRVSALPTDDRRRAKSLQPPSLTGVTATGKAQSGPAQHGHTSCLFPVDVEKSGFPVLSSLAMADTMWFCPLVSVTLPT